MDREIAAEKEPSRPDSGKGRRRRKGVLLIAGILFVGLGVGATFWILSGRSPEAPQEAIQSFETKEVVPAERGRNVEEAPSRIVEGEIKRRSSLAKALSSKHVPSPWIELIVSKLKPLVNLRKIREGRFRSTWGKDGSLIRFELELGPTEVYEVQKHSKGYGAAKEKISLDVRLVKVKGEIRSSLFEAMEAAGEQDCLTMAFADILAWEIDFYKDVQPGDRFALLVEKLYKGDRFVQYGTIEAVEYQRGEKILRGIRYGDAYYNEEGFSLKKAFLKVPLRFTRVSSRFSRGRPHPILGGVRPHLGVDYAAPTGTSVWAVADGTVVFCGWNEGFGKQVILRHRNGYMSYYGHLSRLGRGIKAGKAVKQKEVIGYVGSTGLSTGPHLDYRLAKAGVFRNPLREVFPKGSPIGKAEWEPFRKRRDEIIAALHGENVSAEKPN